MSPSRLSAVATFLASLALALTAGTAFADRPDRGHGNGHGNGHKKHDDDRPTIVLTQPSAPRAVIVVREPSPQRPIQIVIGRELPRDSYRVLDPDLYYRDYGRRIDDRYRYAEAYDGTRILVDIATGVIADILYGTLGSGRPVAQESTFRIPPGHYPPPGLCRVWYPELPPGHQPASGSCNVRVPRGAVLIGG